MFIYVGLAPVCGSGPAGRAEGSGTWSNSSFSGSGSFGPGRSSLTGQFRGTKFSGVLVVSLPPEPLQGYLGCSNTISFTGECERNCRCPLPNTQTGTGYNELSGTMKSALTRLFVNLEAAGACYRWIIGFRDKSYQQDLYDRWHKIADHQQGNQGVCAAEHAAGFAQCPTGYRPNGIANGGPAKPGKSRHEQHQAADISVLFPPNFQKDVAMYRTAASAARLCGPPVSDPVHVELPYAKPPETVARCHFG